MKKKNITRFILVLTILFSCALAASCTIGTGTLDDVLENNGLTSRITYFSNGGYFNDNPLVLSRDIYYKTDSKAFEITTVSKGTNVKRKEYVYDGWCLIETENLDGEDYFVCDVLVENLNSYLVGENAVLIEHNGKIVVKIADYLQLVANKNAPSLVLDEKFDFSSTVLKSGDMLYLAAKWVPDQSIEFILISEDCSSITLADENSTVVNNGEMIGKKSFESSDKFELSVESYGSPAKSSDASFIDYYVYEEGATLENLTPLTEDIDRPSDGSNVKVFAKYVYGNWNVVRSPSDVKGIFALSDKNYYVARDIDCSDLGTVGRVTKSFSGILRGNGHTITGINVEALRLRGDVSVALFGTLTSSAVIKDITFKNISITCSIGPSSSIPIYLIAHTIQDGATPTLSNLTFDGINLDFELGNGASVRNIPQLTEGYDTSNWICTGFDSDAGFFTAYPSVTVKNYQLTINDTVMATDIIEA